MSMFIINWIMCIMILLVARKVCKNMLALICWQIMHSERVMNCIKKHCPEHYEEIIELKREIEEEIKRET